MITRERFLTFLKSRPVRVAFCGGTGVIVQTIVFEIIAVYLHLFSAATADLIAAECGVLTAFFLNERFSFKEHAEIAAARWYSRLLKFNIVTLGSLFIQWVCVFSTEHLTSSWVLIHAAYAAGIVLGFLWNYNGYRLVVWGRTSAYTK